MLIDLDELERLALAATPGPWCRVMEDDECWGIASGPEDVPWQARDEMVVVTDCGNYPPDADTAAYIAAANPQVVMALIDIIRHNVPAKCRVIDQGEHADPTGPGRDPTSAG